MRLQYAFCSTRRGLTGVYMPCLRRGNWAVQKSNDIETNLFMIHATKWVDT